MDETGAAKPRWGFAGSPLVDGDRVLLNVGKAGTALDKISGKILWKSATNNTGYSTPLPFKHGADKAIALFSGKALIAVREKDGKELWEFPWTERWDLNAADPLLIDDKSFVSSFGHGDALLQLGDAVPKILWENKSLAHHFNCGVHLNGFIYGIHGNTDQPEKDLRCLDLKSGEVKWKYNGPGLGSITAAAGKLIVLTDHGELLIAPATPDGFKPIARAQVLGGKCWTVPVLANDRIYCRNAEGTLVCLDVKRSGS
jgi:outer membrane protein assembly factor BamB